MIAVPRPFTATSCLLATVTVIALVGGGCSSSNQGHSAKAASSAASSTAPSTTPAAGLPAGVTQAAAPTNVPNKPAARKNVTLTSCAKTTDGWSAGGTATNSQTSSRTFTITVFFVTTGGTVIGHADTQATVAAGSKSDWSAKSTFTPADTTLCVLRGVA